MKRIFGLFLFLCVAISVFVYAVEVKDGYLYGDLSIAYNNELPSGLFAKSRNYLPGDTLRISNPFTGEEINVLNLSTLDEDGDTVLMLTTEAANKLGIDFKEPLYVRVSPRTNDFDEIAAGSAMLTHNKNAPVQAGDTAVASVPTAESPAKPAPVQEQPPVASAPVVAEPAPVQEQPPVASAPVVAEPKVEPLADLSVLSEEPPVAKAPPAETPKVPEKTEKPVAEKPAAEKPVDKKEPPSEFAEETLVSQGKGKKTSTTVTTVSETVTTAPAASDDGGKVEEVAVRNKKKKAAPARVDKPLDVYEERVQPAPVAQLPKELKGEEPAVELPVAVPAQAGKASPSDEELLEVVEQGFTIPSLNSGNSGSVADVIPVITEESVKLASNGLKEVPSARLAVEEYSVVAPGTALAGDDVVYEYPQTRSTPKADASDELIKELPVSFEPAPVQAVEPVASDLLPAVQAEPVVQPEPVVDAVTVAELPPASELPHVAELAPVDSPVQASDALSSVDASVLVEELPAVSAVPVAQSITAPVSPVEELAYVEPVSLPPMAAVETAYKGPSVQGEQKKPAVAKAKAETPAKEEKKPAVTKAKAETPAKEEKKPAVTKAKAETPAKEEKKPAVTKAKAETPAKEEKPATAKVVKAKTPAKEEASDEDEDVIYTRTDELMLVPSGGEPRAYSGESTSRQRAEEPEEDDDSDIVVNKQDVLTLSPTDSVSPDGQAGDGQKSYTPQKSAPKAESKPATSTGKTASSKPEPAPAASAPAASAPAPAAASSTPATKHAPVQEKDLKAGNYVQFATCTTDAEADSIISKYKKYPIVKVLFEKRAGYKLLVGPLGDDEKGAVLSRFKAFGFSDAYLRKPK